MVVQCPSWKVIAADNSSITSATSYTLGTSVSGSITENGKKYYKFTLPSSGNIHIDEKDFFKVYDTRIRKIIVNATYYKMPYVCWKIYDEKGEQLLSRTSYSNSTTEDIVVNEEMYLTSGT